MSMLENITFDVDEKLLKKAQEKARQDHTTLNELFRRWLKRYILSDKTNFNYEEFMNTLSYVNPGRKFSRDELNEKY